LTAAPEGGVAPAGAPSNNSLLVNWIGLNAAATDVVPNGNGVILTGSDNTLDGNRVSGNTGLGVWLLDADNNNLSQNGVGLKTNNLMGAGNGSHGIQLTNANGNRIGYSRTTGNAIISNGGNGVFVESGTGNTIRFNSIWENAGLGIDLVPAGVNPDDPQDTDAGANDGPNYPFLTGATRTGDTQTVTGALNSTPNQTFTIDFYQTEGCPPSGVGTGAHYSGAATITTDGNGDATFSVHPEYNIGTLQIVATATDSDGNTSEFSPCRAVTNGNAGVIQFTQTGYSINEGGGAAIITVARTGGSDGVVYANFSTSDGAATAGSDYTTVMQTISYGDGETGTKIISIPVTDDNVDEGDETVNLSLSGTTLDSAPPPGATIQFTSTLTIMDNEAAPTPTPTPTSTTIAIVVSPASVTGSKSSVATVTLPQSAPAKGAKVLLSSSDTSAATVPASVTVAAGATAKTFTVTTKAVPSLKDVLVTATYQDQSAQAHLTVLPPVLDSLALKPATITYPCQSSTGTIGLNAKAPAGGVVINLTNTNSGAQVPGSVTVPEGATSATFTIIPLSVSGKSTGAVTALPADSNFGTTAFTRSLTVMPNRPTSLTMPTSVTGPATVTATVSVACPAPAGGQVLAVSTSKASVAQPVDDSGNAITSVIIPEGQTQATFKVSAADVNTMKKVTIRATFGGFSKGVTLTVN
jgi:parallel beta-helix repeat protein